MWKQVITFAAISVGISASIALGLILSQRPVTDLPEGPMSFDDVATAPRLASAQLVKDTARDGATLTAWHVPARVENAPLLVLVHGSGWHGAQFDQLAAQLDGTAEVLAVNLRGHFNGPGTRGDVDYLGQFEDDLADVIKARRQDGQKVVLAGHSSGGGLVVRFAGGAHRDLIDAAVLMAPFLKYNAPTTRENSGGWAHVLTRRVIGLSMLNMARINVLDHLTVIQFAMPAEIRNGPKGHEATLAYSWRLNQSFAPRADYLVDVAKLPDFLLLVGSEDESFVAEGYEPLMSEVTQNGTYVVVEGANHLGVVHADETVARLRGFLENVR
ncbi:putative magnesium chelatase accessory protein [Shimia thalassica]|uniref:Putative magnesium chelatase accessory protein n=1 Tax=Shimia thalassica TaxID=1715693 RepID=A0A0N7M980_9RHOB|nr:alpha/beta fold hydrolase [Shimia thalassica]CUJ95717.1 putative magnesium chelatase accessory protein [Shimia thalassica]